ncbi:MAG: Gfo/Idh/MocA family oxidoreductase [Alphaproteobacteria bacterium]|jgi:predicted dehydrogenase|nr:Gfo/Idh/MocA family oxidoreductase [Alphaproteobacteria bacterium]
MPDMRLGLIGAGRWGRVYMNTLGDMTGVALGALASSNPQSRDLVDKNVAVHENWRDLINAGGVEGIIVATPPATHAEIVRAALEAGLPVLVEKPLTLDVDEARALCDLAEKRDGLVMVDHIHLFSPAFRALKREAAGLGPLRRMESEAGSHGPFRKATSVLWDWGAHDISMCLDLMGEAPSDVSARCLEMRETGEGSGAVFDLRLGFGDKDRDGDTGGVAAGIRIGNLLPGKRRRFCAAFDSGILVHDDLAADKLTFVPTSASPEAEMRTIAVAADPPLTCAVREFTDAIAAGSRSLESLHLGLSVVETLARCEAALDAPHPE